MSSLEHGAMSNSNAERAAREAREGTLNDLREEIGPVVYESIIEKLSTGEISDLSDEEKAIISRIKKDKGLTEH